MATRIVGSVLAVVIVTLMAGCPLPQGEDAEVPSVPTGLSVGSPTSTSLHISWNASDRAESYQLFRDAEPDGAYALLVYKGASLWFTNGGLLGGKDYYYKVRATNEHGASALSAYATGTTDLPSPPSIPTGFTVVSTTKTSVSLSWNAATGATGYRVYRDDSETGPFTWEVYSGPLQSCTDTNLQTSTDYYYRVQASNSGGSSALSAPILATTQSGLPPAVPTGLSVGSPTITTLQLSWNGSSDAESYRLYRSLSSDSGYSLVYDGSLTAYEDSPLDPGTTYFYRIQALNGNGESDLSASESGPTISGTPTGLQVGSASSTSLTISWDAALGAAGYQVYRDTSPTGQFLTKRYDGDQTALVDSPLSSATTYHYKVRSYNVSGESPLSFYASGTTSDPPLTAPTGVTATSNRSDKIVISWNAVTRATSYDIAYSRYPDFHDNLDFLQTSATSYDLYTGSGIYWYFKVRARAGAELGPYSGVVQGIRQP